MIREPNTDPIPAPDPATPTVAAPAPINLAAESISFLLVVVVNARLAKGVWKKKSKYQFHDLKKRGFIFGERVSSHLSCITLTEFLKN